MNNFSKPICSIIKSRMSWRTFKPTQIPQKEMKLLEAFINEDASAPFGTGSRFFLVTKRANEKNDKPQKLGTYGVIKDANDFVVGVTKNNKEHLIDFGFLFERIILRATDLGLGTCWLGGTFKASNFLNSVVLRNDEVIPCVTPVGIKNDTRGLIDRLFAWSAKSHMRRPWEKLFFDRDWKVPLHPEEAGVYRDALEMLRLAPSASNRQPWQVLRTMNQGKPEFHFFLKRTPGYYEKQKMLNVVDLQLIDIGIAMCHFELTIREHGGQGDWVDNDFDLNPHMSEVMYIKTWC